MEQKLRYCLCFLAAFLIISIAVAIGYAAGSEWPVAATVLSIAELLPLCAFCRLAPIEFGAVGLTRHQLLVHIFIVTLLGLAVGMPFALLYQMTDDPQMHLLLGLVCTVICGSCVALLSGRPIYLCGALFILPHGFHGTLLPIHEATPAYTPWYGWVLSAYFLCTSFARYKKDQSTLGMLTVAIGGCIAYGEALEKNPTNSPHSLFIMAVFAYAQMLWMRRGRRFPPGLSGCRFVSLDYLRRVASSREGIKRCQDLPAEAFGDPQKARYVISVSHRWLDRYTCDIKSDDYPEGMRLHTMVAALDEYFSVRGIGKGQGLINRFQRLAMALTGGRDVVLFFDFMCLPQEALAEDGTIQTRSHHEQKLFSRCLPNMGALYSMLPVLVCEQVPEGVRPYLDSGWCFAEVSTAWLGNQLNAYSSQCRAALGFRRTTFRNANDPKQFAVELDDELNNKYFLREQDRDQVRNIIRGFHTKSRLVAALKKKSSADLSQVLASSSMRAFGLLDQAVDSELNTPLHLAVAHNFPDGVKQLLESGARRDLRNLRGDLPADLFMFPRLSAAAFTCRKYVIIKSFEHKLAHRLDAVRKNTFRSNSNSKSLELSLDTSLPVTNSKMTVSFDQESPTHSDTVAGTCGLDAPFWSSSASFWVSQAPTLDTELEQPNSTSGVLFFSATEDDDITSPQTCETSEPYLDSNTDPTTSPIQDSSPTARAGLEETLQRDEPFKDSI